MFCGVIGTELHRLVTSDGRKKLVSERCLGLGVPISSVLELMALTP